MHMKATATKKKVSYAKWGYLFILPFFLVFLVFQLVPLVSTFYYSFFEYYRDGLTVVGPNFVGLKNYQELLSADLPKYIGNTIVMWLIGFIPQIIVSLVLAAWFTDVRLRIKGKTFFKVVIYLPNLIMASAFAMLFFALFSVNGPVNGLLKSLSVICTVKFCRFEHRRTDSHDCRHQKDRRITEPHQKVHQSYQTSRSRNR